MSTVLWVILVHLIELAAIGGYLLVRKNNKLESIVKISKKFCFKFVCIILFIVCICFALSGGNAMVKFLVLMIHFSTFFFSVYLPSPQSFLMESACCLITPLKKLELAKTSWKDQCTDL